MAYFYNSSNYSEVPDNYQYYQYYYNHDSTNYDSRYVQYYNTDFHGNAYQHAPTPPLVGYYYSNYSLPESLTSKNAVFHENNDYYNEPVSTEFVVYHNTTNAVSEASDVVSEEYNPEPFHGGYDINEKYGKPMSPNEKICYPKDKVDPNAPSLGDLSYGSVPSPYVKEDKKVESETEPKQANGVAPKEVIHEEHPSDFDDDEEDDDDYDDDDDDDYDDDEDDVDGVDDGDKKGGEKQEDLGKEASKSTAVIAALDGAHNKKEEQNLEGVPKPKDGGIAGEVIQEKKAPDFEASKEEEEEEEDDDDDYDDEEDDYDDDDVDDYGDDNEGQKGKGEEKEGVLINKEPPKTIPIPPSDDAINKEPPKTIIPLPPSDDAINKEPPKTIPIPPSNDAPHGKEAPTFEGEAKPKNGSEVIQEEKPSNFEQEKEEIKGGSIDQGGKEEDQGNQIRRQIPPGYGMEALDLCEGIFGGYFPCLWKRKQGNNINEVHQQSGYYENMSDYDYCCKETVDYLFGNPNPYGGSMPEKGSYGDPIYSYQRYYPQQPLTEQVEYYGGNSSLMHHGSRYYYGYNGDYQ